MTIDEHLETLSRVELKAYALEHYDRAALAQRFVSLVDDLVAGSR